MNARLEAERKIWSQLLSDRLLHYRKMVCSKRHDTRLARLLIEARRLALKDEYARGLRKTPKPSVVRYRLKRREERRRAREARAQGHTLPLPPSAAT